MKTIGRQRSQLQYTLESIRRNWGLYLLLLPAVALTVCFAYIPMYGIIIAFKDFKPMLGITGSPWANPLLKYFIKFFNSFQFESTIRNTLVINIYSLLVGFPLPVIFALMINQMQVKWFKRTFQTITYMPHFISMVVMVGIILLFLSPGSGLIGNLYRLFGLQAPNLMGISSAFSSIYVWSDIWQHVGWDSIIFVAALSAVDPSLYEAATVDGAKKRQKLWYIDMPMLIPTVVLLLILRAGNMMNIGFEKVYLMQNDLNLLSSEVIATYVYKMGIISAQYSYSSAINMFNTIVNFILLISVNEVSKRLSGNSL